MNKRENRRKWHKFNTNTKTEVNSSTSFKKLYNLYINLLSYVQCSLNFIFLASI